MLQRLIARYPVKFGTAILLMLAAMWLVVLVLCLCRVAGRRV